MVHKRPAVRTAGKEYAPKDKIFYLNFKIKQIKFSCLILAGITQIEYRQTSQGTRVNAFFFL